MRLKKFILFALLLTSNWVLAQPAKQSIPLDKDVRIGKLDNGLTYYIRYNNWPEKRANFYIAQKVGSIQEEESQRGLAHFLEHMCFNGTKHFPNDALLRWCESIGVKFGTDINAYTSIDETVYNIDNVPTTRQSVLDSCMLILADWAGNLQLDPKEIDQERGVIHEEWRLRTSASSRMFERNLPKLYPGSKYGVRYPIGLMSVIDNFKYKDLSDYYHKWYHPNNQGIIIVGDVDVDHTEAMIKKLFGSMKNPKDLAPIVDEQVPDNAEPIVIIDKDKEQRSSSVQLMFKHDVIPNDQKDDINYMVYNYARNIGVSLMNQRLREFAQKPDCPFVGAGVDDGNYIFAKTKDAFSITAAPKEITLTADALQAALTEVRRAAIHGFTATEYERTKANMLSGLEKAYSNKDKRHSVQFVSEYKEHFLANEPMPSLDDYYSIMKQLIASVPVEYVNRIFASLVSESDSNMVIINFNNEKEGNVYPTEAQLLGAVKAARAESNLTAFVDNVKNEPLITKLPKAGKIKSEKKNEQFGYTELKLSNGVTVLLKKTDYKKDQVMLSGTGGGGASFYGEKDFTNLKMFDDVIGLSGLGSFTSTELIKACAGKIANANLTMSDRRMSLTGSSTPKDVETMLQFAYLYFTDIHKDQDAFNTMIEGLKTNLKNRTLSPDIAFNDSLTTSLYGYNQRFAPLLEKDIKDIDYDRILAIAKERTANANGWRFTIIGNYDEANIRQLVCQYLGALPSKGKNVAGERLGILRKGIINNDFKRKMETPKANAAMVWYNEDMPYTQERSIQASITGQILSMLYIKKIREEASAAYSCSASGSASRDDNYSNITIFASCPMKPDKSEECLRIMNEEVNNMAVSCDASMLDKVKEYMLKEADNSVKTNGYWLGIINSFYRYGIDYHSNYKSTIAAQTPEKISEFMKEFLKAGNRIRVTMMPAE